MIVRHFYHVWAAGAWSEPVREHTAALRKSKFPGPVTVGLVGPADDRAVARDRIAGEIADVEWVEADRGYEQVTLWALHDWALENSGAVLYAHTKGAWDSSDWNACWRRSMTRRVVVNWRQCQKLLAGGYDTVGCHYLTPAEWPSRISSPIYGGNFWWATTDYLRRLPRVAEGSRYRAEKWIGLGRPHAADLLPGWPSEELCAA